MKGTVAFYQAGQDRNEPNALTHTYAVMAESGDIYPMCSYGWNRSDGTRLSIFRGSPDTEGDCLKCKANKEAGKEPIFDGFPHKTKWS